MRTRRWLPAFLFVCALVGAWIGYAVTGERSWLWTVGGVAVGFVVAVVIQHWYRFTHAS